MFEVFAVVSVMGAIAHLATPWLFLSHPGKMLLAHVASALLFGGLVYCLSWINFTYFKAGVGDDGSGIGSALLIGYTVVLGAISLFLAMLVHLFRRVLV